VGALVSSLPAQFIAGLASLEFTVSSKGVDKSGIKSPDSSQIKKDLRPLSIAYSVFSQVERSSSYEMKPLPLLKYAN